MTEPSIPFSDPLCPIFVDDAEALAEWEKILAEIRESTQDEALAQQPVVDHDAVTARDKMNCPECGFVIDTQAAHCMFCRVILINAFPASPEGTVDHSAFR